MLLASLSVGSCFVASAYATPTGAIAGKVTDVETSKPIEGIEVCALPTAPGPEEEGEATCAKTSSSGEYTISGLNDGSYVVAFGPPYPSTLDYIPQYYNDKLPPKEPDTVTVSSGATTHEVNAALQAGGEITGTVTNASTGAAIEGALVCAVRIGGQEGLEISACGRSGANGAYTIAGLPNGEFDVLFAAPGVVLQFFPGKTSITEAGHVTISAAKEVKTGIDAAMQPRPPEPTSGEGPETGSSGPGLTGLPGGGPLAGPLGAPRLPVSLGSPRIRVNHRAVALVKLACAGTAGCRGRLILSIKRVEHRKGKTLTWVVPLGAERYSLRRGVHTTVRVRLDEHARALLRADRGLLQARLTIDLRVASKTHVELQSVVLTDRRPAAGH